MGSKEKYLDKLYTYNESPAETCYKALIAKPVFKKKEKLQVLLNKTIALLALFHVVNKYFKC